MNLMDILLIILVGASIGLVIALILLLNKVMGVLKTADDVLKETKNSLDIITKDVDSLSIEVEGLLNKTSHLLDDVNGKLSKTDPVFDALGELGVSVSHVNQSAIGLTKSFKLKREHAESSMMKMGKSMTRIFRQLKKKPSKTSGKKY